MQQKQRTILIVDDCPQAREVYRRYLLQDSICVYKILAEENGENGLEWCKKLQPDVILLDFMLPDMDGLEFLSELKAQTGKTKLPVVMLTEGGNDAIAITALKNGAIDYLDKGKTSPECFRIAIHNVMKSTHLQRQLEECEERFRASVETMVDGFGIYTSIRDESAQIVDFQVEYVNAAACEINGISKEKQIGKRLCELLPAHRETKLFDEYCQVVETGEPLVKEFFIYSEVYGDQCLSKVFDIRAARLGDGFVATWRDITEKNQAEEQLQENQRFIQQIADTTPGLLYVYDLIEERNIYLNRRVAEILGYTPQQIQEMGKSLFQRLMHPDDLAQVPSHFQRFGSIGEGEVIKSEYRLRHFNGEWRWFCSRESVFSRTADGLPKQILGTALDITDRKRVEEQLRLSNERFQLVATAVNCMIYDCDTEKDRVERTEALTQIVGYSLQEVEPTSAWWRERIHPDDWQHIREQTATILAKGGRYAVEYRVRHKNDQYVYVLDQGLVVLDAENRPVRVVGSITDISDRKQAEQQLHESQQFIQRITETTPGLSYIYDAIEHRNVYINRSIAEILGYTPQQIQEMGTVLMQKLIHPDDIPRWLEHIQRLASATDDDILEFEYRMQHANGEWRWLYSRDTVFTRTANGSVHQILGTALDITERKRAEEELRRANERFQLAAAAVNCLIYDWDTERNTVERTEGLTQILGYSLEETEPTNTWWRERIHPDDLQRATDEAAAKLADGNRYAVEYRVRKKDDRYVYVLDQGIMLRDSEGRPVRAVGSTTDISDRKQAEEALRQSEARFRRIFDEAPIGISLVDMNYRLVQVNHAFAQMLGYTQEELTELTFAEITHPEDRAMDVSSAKQLFEGKIPSYNIHKRYIKKNGEILWVALTATAIRDCDGNALYGLGMVQDISDRKRTEEALRHSEERYRYLAEAIPQFVWTTNADGQLEYVNQRWCEYSGLSVEQTLDGGLLKVYHPDDLQPALNRWTETLQTGTTYQVEARFKRASDEAYHWFLVRALPIKDEQGRVVKWLGTSTDINDQKQIEAERALLLEREQAAREEAEAANRAKDDFVAMVSHDLRAPLNSILGWTQLLRTRKFDRDAIARALDIIERNARSQAKLLEDLLDVSRMIQGKLEIHSFPIELIPIVETAIHTAYPTANVKSIGLESVIDASIGRISGDPNRLQQVLGNLLTNAIKFTPEGGRIEVRLERVEEESSGDKVDKGDKGDKGGVSNPYAKITVSDTGQGISPEFLPHVFDRFRQSGSGSKKGGLGLGLAIARHLVQLHGGTIHAESPGIGQGATFIIKLPLLNIL